MLEWTNYNPDRLPPSHPPVMCIIVDTEEEFDWTQPFSRENIATKSVAAQLRIHEQVYDLLKIVPTYVVDWPVATTASASKILYEILKSGRCEIGAHLHPWVTPPYVETVNSHNSYAGNLPVELEYEKIRLLTNAINDNFLTSPLVFKAGRYGLGPNTANILEQLGYKIDASVVPYTGFTGDGGPDFTSYKNQIFWFGNGKEPMMSLPVTTDYCGLMQDCGPWLYSKLEVPVARKLHAKGILARSRMLERIRLSPEGNSFAEIKRLMRKMAHQSQPITLTYHSPSLLPGCTPYVRTEKELGVFINTIEQCCMYFQEEMGGVFMSATQLRESLLKCKG